VDRWCPVAESATGATTDEIGAVVRSNRTTTDLDPLRGNITVSTEAGRSDPTNEKGTAIMKLTTTTTTRCQSATRTGRTGMMRMLSATRRGPDTMNTSR
jgi:hypothetical protein